MKVSKILKACAYLFLGGNIIREAYQIAVNTSYLNTGKLMGVESMFMLLWSCFVSFIIALVIYGLGEIIEYYEIAKEKHADDCQANLKMSQKSLNISTKISVLLFCEII